MSTFFSMPKLGLDMTSGVIVQWLVKEGTAVKAGQPILEIETDKAAQEIPAPVDGILARILMPEGSEVPCGEYMAILLAPGESLPAGEINKPQGSSEHQPVTVAPVSAEVHAEAASAGRILVSPVAKRRARELGIDLESVSTKDGKINLEDIEEAYRRKQEADSGTNPPDSGEQEMSATRRKIAEHMSRSARTAARVGLTLEVDTTALVAWRDRVSIGEKKVSFNILLAKLVALALREYPYMNAQLKEDAIVHMPEINIGVAVDTPKGLVVPVLHQADRRDTAALQAEYEGLCERALAGKSRLEDLQGGTFTITNLGSLEIETFLPMINVPECAILGVGAIIKKPVVIDDQVVIRARLGLTLAFDHRLVDGVPAGHFLQRIKRLVESAGKE